MRKIYLLGLLYVGLNLLYLMRAPEPLAIPIEPSVTVIDDPSFTVTVTVEDEPGDPMDAGSWFRSMKAYCNPVEVDTRITWSPAPESAEGTAYEAACYALAGRIESAREVRAVAEVLRQRGVVDGGVRGEDRCEQVPVQEVDAV